MPKTFSFSHVDTPVSGATTTPIILGKLNYGADFAVQELKSGESLLTNLRSPLNMPEKVFFGYRQVADMYAKSGIPASNRSQNTKGVSFVFRHTDVGRKTDSADVTYEVLMPFSCHFVVTVPMDETITADIVRDYILRTVACAFESGSNTSARIETALRGVALPADLK